ncbi:hypothetical protein ACMD2_22030, partial [Ananas comosus]
VTTIRWISKAFKEVRNQLAYARLEKLVYVHYNMRFRLRCMQEEYDKEKKLNTYNLLDASFIDDELDPILDCLQDRESRGPIAR